MQVIVQSLPELPDGDPFWDMMKSIWAAQKARGHIARSVVEVEGDFRRESFARSADDLVISDVVTSSHAAIAKDARIMIHGDDE